MIKWIKNILINKNLNSVKTEIEVNFKYVTVISTFFIVDNSKKYILNRVL